MGSSVYSVNKGINKSIEFKGLKAQYIWYLGIGLVGLMILFAILYISGVNAFISVFLILCAGTCLFLFVYRLSNRYGEHGLMKKIARRRIPSTIKCFNRKLFTKNQRAER